MKDHYSKYLKICQQAVEDEKAFKTFRNHVEYVAVVEACGQSHGADYLSVIEKNYPYLLSYISRFISSDEIGSPAVFHYSGMNEALSPTTLRYIKVLGDLMNLFDELDDMDIVEIGGGYGGQCKIIYDVTSPRSYTIVDLPEALKLSEKYLKCFGIKNVKFKIPDDNFDTPYSLCISNYAFSEVSYEYQKKYAEKIIEHCDRGYMICNHFSKEKSKLMYDLEIFKSREGRFSPEEPLTGINNILYTWNLIAK